MAKTGRSWLVDMRRAVNSSYPYTADEKVLLAKIFVKLWGGAKHENFTDEEIAFVRNAVGMAVWERLELADGQARSEQVRLSKLRPNEYTEFDRLIKQERDALAEPMPGIGVGIPEVMAAIDDMLIKVDVLSERLIAPVEQLRTQFDSADDLRAMLDRHNQLRAMLEAACDRQRDVVAAAHTQWTECINGFIELRNQLIELRQEVAGEVEEHERPVDRLSATVPISRSVN